MCSGIIYKNSKPASNRGEENTACRLPAGIRIFIFYELFENLHHLEKKSPFPANGKLEEALFKDRASCLSMCDERKREIDQILKKTEEDMKREDCDPRKGIPRDEFLKRQGECSYDT